MRRLDRVRKKMEEAKVDLLIVTKPANLYYLTGLLLSEGTYLIHETEDLYVDKRYVALRDSRGFKEPKIELLERLKSFKHIGFEGGWLCYDRVKKWVEANHTANFISCQIVEEVRMVKDKEEILALEKAAFATTKTLLFLHQLVEEGVSEEKIAQEVKNPSFDTIVAFAEHSAFPHHRPTKRGYKSGQTVLIDCGVIVDQYHGDMTRTYHSPLINQVKEAHDAAIELCKPGIALEELDRLVKSKIPFKDHGLLHGIGLETHELPSMRTHSKTILEPGMCLAIEPGLYVPTIGGARYENMVCIESDGCRILTNEN